MMTVKEVFKYTGVNNLEVMQEAVRYNQFLTDLILAEVQPGDLVLDFGAGVGTFARRIAKLGIDVECMEPDEELAESLRSQGFSVYLDAGNIEASKYDYIYTLNVLEHIEDDSEATHHLRRILKPGGRLLVYVPAFQVLFGAMDRRVAHFRRYTIGSLKTLLHGCGFDIQKNEYVDFLGFFVSLIFNWVGDKDGKINPRAIQIYDRWIFPVSRSIDMATAQICGKNVLALCSPRTAVDLAP